MIVKLLSAKPGVSKSYECPSYTADIGEYGVVLRLDDIKSTIISLPRDGRSIYVTDLKGDTVDSYHYPPRPPRPPRPTNKHDKDTNPSIQSIDNTGV